MFKDRTKAKANALFVGIALFVGTLLLPIADANTSGPHLSQEGRTVLALFVLALVLWLTEALPFAVTSLAILLLIPLLGITDGITYVRGAPVPVSGLDEGFTYVLELGFANPVIFFALGLMLLSVGISHSGLGRRVIVVSLSRLKATRSRILLGFLAIGSVLGMWCSAFAGAALLLPMVQSVAHSIDEEDSESSTETNKRFKTALAISAAWAPLLGGMATPIGTVANLVALDYLEELAGVHISFLQWMVIGVPVVALLIPLSWFVLKSAFHVSAEDISKSMVRLRANMGPMTGDERRIAGLFGLTVGLLLFAPLLAGSTGLKLTNHWIAFAGGLLLFFPGVSTLEWRDALTRVDWNTLLLIGPGLAIGRIAYDTGTLGWISQSVVQQIASLSLIMQVVSMITMIAILKLFLNSTTITSVVVVPILIKYSLAQGIEVTHLALPAALASSVGLILITQSATNVALYSTGYIGLRDMMFAGAIVTVSAIIVIALVTNVAVPLFT